MNHPAPAAYFFLFGSNAFDTKLLLPKIFFNTIFEEFEIQISGFDYLHPCSPDALDSKNFHGTLSANFDAKFLSPKHRIWKVWSAEPAKRDWRKFQNVGLESPADRVHTPYHTAWSEYISSPSTPQHFTTTPQEKPRVQQKVPLKFWILYGCSN